ncbi:hypothetical protein HA461_20475 [Rhizobium leguminosarum bv. trifolii]|uniref:hypothetical protein n=1 Tax=Rhizobium leguminosarum TaxID=384 RepID=UPI00140FF2C0|nr:hypothetical protein [Rhizobium leguminosarum]QIO53398.1 hypothetical protein HA461_20475 [Rhizobium leguminosarum bv. trifolii]
MTTNSYDDIGDDDLVPLAKACKIFLHGHLTKSSLRTEHAKGTLEIIRIANKDFVTRNGIRRMIERCAARTKETAPQRKLAQEKQARAAEIASGLPRAAVKARLKQLRDSLPVANPKTSEER